MTEIFLLIYIIKNQNNSRKQTSSLTATISLLILFALSRVVKLFRTFTFSMFSYFVRGSWPLLSKTLHRLPNLYRQLSEVQGFKNFHELFEQVDVERDRYSRKNGNDELNEAAGEEKVVLVNRHSNGRLKATRWNWNSADDLFTFMLQMGISHVMNAL